MKVICQKNCLKKQSISESKKQMAHIGELTFISGHPKFQIEVIKSKKKFITPIKK